MKGRSVIESLACTVLATGSCAMVRGMDLATAKGAMEFEKRIREAATSSCKEMDVKFPVEGDGEADCIKHAVDGAMSRANTIIAAKGGAAPK